MLYDSFNREVEKPGKAPKTVPEMYDDVLCSYKF
jgi:hypothetical protein